MPLPPREAPPCAVVLCTKVYAPDAVRYARDASIPRGTLFLRWLGSALSVIGGHDAPLLERLKLAWLAHEAVVHIEIAMTYPCSYREGVAGSCEAPSCCRRTRPYHTVMYTALSASGVTAKETARMADRDAWLFYEVPVTDEEAYRLRLYMHTMLGAPYRDISPMTYLTDGVSLLGVDTTESWRYYLRHPLVYADQRTASCLQRATSERVYMTALEERRAGRLFRAVRRRIAGGRRATSSAEGAAAADEGNVADDTADSESDESSEAEVGDAEITARMMDLDWHTMMDGRSHARYAAPGAVAALHTANVLRDAKARPTPMSAYETRDAMRERLAVERATSDVIETELARVMAFDAVMKAAQQSPDERRRAGDERGNEPRTASVRGLVQSIQAHLRVAAEVAASFPQPAEDHHAAILERFEDLDLCHAKCFTCVELVVAALLAAGLIRVPINPRNVLLNTPLLALRQTGRVVNECALAQYTDFVNPRGNNYRGTKPAPPKKKPPVAPDVEKARSVTDALVASRDAAVEALASVTADGADRKADAKAPAVAPPAVPPSTSAQSGGLRNRQAPVSSTRFYRSNRTLTVRPPTDTTEPPPVPDTLSRVQKTVLTTLAAHQPAQ